MSYHTLHNTYKPAKPLRALQKPQGNLTKQNTQNYDIKAPNKNLVHPWPKQQRI